MEQPSGDARCYTVCNEIKEIIMKKTLLLLVACLIGFTATAQQSYELEQRFDDSIKSINIGSGWQVRLVQDTVNSLVVFTPCEYYFTEGNEPEICIMDNGELTLYNNHYMPQGTRVEIHHLEGLQYVRLEERATIVNGKLTLKGNTSYHELVLNPRSRMDVDTLISKANLCNIITDTSAVLNIGTIEGGNFSLINKKGSTVNIGTNNAKKLECTRHPESYGNLQSDGDKVVVDTNTLWFRNGLKKIDGNIHYSFFNYYDHHHDSPYNASYGFRFSADLLTNHIYFANRWWFGFGYTVGYEIRFLSNDVEAVDRHLQLASSPIQGRMYQTLFNGSVGIIYNFGYTPKTKWLHPFIYDVHFGLTPTINFGQGLSTAWLNSNDHVRSTSDRQKALSAFQLRLNVGVTIPFLRALKADFFIDLLPTYRPSADAPNIHSFGIQFTF